MQEISAAEAIHFLSEYLTERRKSLIDTVLSKRTRYVTVVLEDIYKPQNASAVLRTCECQGIQDLHIIEKNHLYEVNPDVVKGASKWLTIYKYEKEEGDTTRKCFDHLRKNGYRIVATDPRGKRPVQEVGLDQKIALVFGTEYEGLSETAKENCDELVNIPMYGFTESYNLSVSAAICLQSLTTQLRGSEVNWQLTEEEREALKLLWYKGQVRDADAMIAYHFSK